MHGYSEYKHLISRPLNEASKDAKDLTGNLKDKAVNNSVVSRRGFLKILGGAVAGAVVLKVTHSVPGCASNENVDKTELINDETIKELFQNQTVADFEEGEAKDLMNKWYKRYMGEDPEYDAFRFKKGVNKPDYLEMIEGFKRMQDSGHLRMVMEKCKKEGVPLDVVFLAIAESYWKGDAQSKYAGGFWQFTKGTAALPAFEKFNFYKEGEYDNRDNPEISTDAALEHLRLNHLVTENWDRNGSFEWAGKISESDRWKWSMWLYNISPRGLKKHYVESKGNAELYPVSQDNEESENYVPRILAIRKALLDLYTDETKFANLRVLKEKEEVKTYADWLFEEYVAKRSSRDPEENLTILLKIEKAFDNEYCGGKITKKYYDGALAEVSKEKKLISKFDSKKLAKSEVVGTTKIERRVDETGFMKMIVVGVGKDTFKVSLENYKIQHGDAIDILARRLCGDPNKVALTVKIIKQANPGLKDNILRIGQNIKIPAKEIVVPSIKLSELIKKYYPGYVLKGDLETPAYYLKYLNGKNHKKLKDKENKILVGDKILVPVIK